MTPGLSHALIGLAIWGAVTLLALPVLPASAAVLGVAAAAFFYIGRERRQSEEFFGSNRIPPWRWRPRAFRDMAWPIGAALAAAALASVASRIGGALLVDAVLS